MARKSKSTNKSNKRTNDVRNVNKVAYLDEASEEEDKSMPVDQHTADHYSVTHIDTQSSITIDVEESNDHSAEKNGSSSTKSLVWNYAQILPNGKAKCSKCNTEISMKDFSTSCLRRHLASCQKLSIFKSNKKSQTTSSKISAEVKQKLDKLVYNCLIQDGRSFGDFQKPGMVRFLREAVPGYQPPVRRTVQRHIKRLHDEHVNLLAKKLKMVKSMSVTTDLWSDKQLRSYLGLTGHYLNEQGQLESTVLSFTVFRQRHSADKIGKTIERVLDELEIRDKTNTITCDGAANICKAVDMLDVERIHCLGHKLHLTVCNALCLWVNDKHDVQSSSQMDDNEAEDDFDDSVSMNSGNSKGVITTSGNDVPIVPDNEMDCDDDSSHSTDVEDGSIDDDCSGEIQDDVIGNWDEGVVEDIESITCAEQLTVNKAIGKCRGLVKMLGKSSTLSMFFAQYKEQLKVKSSLMIDCRSRWNSTFRLIRGILVYKSVINRLYAEKYGLNLSKNQQSKLIEYELNGDEWVALESVEEILKSFFQATKMISGKKYCTIGIALFALVNLKEYLEDRTKNLNVNILKKLLLSQLNHYFQKDSDQVNFLESYSFFDPLGFGSLDRSDRLSIEKEIKQMAKNVSMTTIDSSSTNSSIVQVKTCGNDNSIQCFLSSVGKMSRDTNAQVSVLSIEEELALYRSLASREYADIVEHGKVHDPFEFWNRFDKKLPVLAFFARQRLIVSATSVPSESLFSIAAYIGRKERSRLTPDNLSMSVFLKDKVNQD